MPTDSVTLWERISLFPRLLLIPGIIVYTTCTSFLSKRKLYRNIFDAVSRFITSVASVRQLQWVNGPGEKTYRAWAKTKGIEPCVEKIGADQVRIYWVGDRNAENIVLYIHGGGFMLPIGDFMFTFWDLMQEEMRTHSGKRVGIAVLDYSLHPATFPTRLVEVIEATNFLLRPDNVSRTEANITLAGDSCGANIILQLLSHSLHPIPGIQPSPIKARPLRSALLISPWTSLDEETPSHRTNTSDALKSSTLRNWGALYLSEMPSAYIPYVKVQHAPREWLDELEKIVDRVMITTGTEECLWDDAIGVRDQMARLSGVEFEFDVEEGGVHDDPIFDIGAGGKRLNNAGVRMAKWIAAGLC